MAKPIGIDLGTTNCCMAWVQDGTVVVYRDEHQQTVMPSLVAQAASGDILVGSRARGAKTVVYRHGFVKRAMGTPQRFPLLDGDKAAFEISALLLGELRRRAVEALGDDVEAVITVPAHFQERHRQETLWAAEQAGLPVIALLEEPIAAAIAYHHEKHALARPDADQTILVYDVGGGTTDCSVCVRHGGHITVGARGTAYDGDKYLGGVDFDKSLVGLAAAQLSSQGFELTALADDMPASAWLWELMVGAEHCKHELSREVVVQWTQALEWRERGARASLDLWVSRAEFETAIAHHVDRTLALCDRALLNYASDGRLHGDDQETASRLRQAAASLDQIILVGGSTLVPGIRSRLRQHFEALAGHEVEIAGFRPYECVAMGAALFASLEMQQREVGRSTDFVRWEAGAEPLNQVGSEVSYHPELRGRVMVASAFGGHAELASTDGIFQTSVGASGEFVLAPFALAAGANDVDLSFFDSARFPVGALRLAIARSGLSVGNLGLAQAITVRLVDGFDELLPPGTRAGSTHSKVYYLSDRSAVARCPLYQGHLPIGTLTFRAGAEPGTQVLLESLYGQHGLSVTVTVEGGERQSVHVTLDATPDVGERGRLLQRFHDVQRRVEFLFEQAADSPPVKRLQLEVRALNLDIETELANPVVADLYRIDDRIRQLEMIEVLLKAITKEGLAEQIAETRAEVLAAGGDTELLRELDDLQQAIQGSGDREVLAALLGRLSRVAKRLELKRPREVTQEMAEFLVGRIQSKLSSVRRALGGGDDDPRVAAIERSLAGVRTGVKDLPTLVNRLWRLEMDFVDELYREVVIEKGQEGLLRLSPR